MSLVPSFYEHVSHRFLFLRSRRADGSNLFRDRYKRAYRTSAHRSLRIGLVFEHSSYM